VTSSNTTVGGAMAGTGVGADAIDYVLGICKAYATASAAARSRPSSTTRSARASASARRVRRHHRPAAPLRLDRHRGLEACVAINGISGLCITKLDILDGMPTLKMCVAYKYRGKQTEYAPLDAQGWDECEPVYLEFPGWTENTAGITEWDKLPAAARAYLRALEELSGCPLAIVSTGPGREATMILRDPWRDGPRNRVKQKAAPGRPFFGTSFSCLRSRCPKGG